MLLASAVHVLVVLVGRSSCQGFEGQFRLQTESPTNVVRDTTWYEWCNCGTGLTSVAIWPDEDKSQAVTVKLNLDHTHLAHQWVRFQSDAEKISFSCNDNANGVQSNKKLELKVRANQWLTLLYYSARKEGFLGTCKKNTGRLKLNTWSHTDYVSSVPFTTGTEGYACFKIPSMLSTQANTLIAFAEARTPDCDDFSRTDVVYKRSRDGGQTWGPLLQLRDAMDINTSLPQGECGNDLVVGNIAPVQLRSDSKAHPGRILVPYTRNNFRHYIVHSDDDGLTFSGDRELSGTTVTDAHPDCNRNMSYFGFDIEKINLRSIGDITEWLKSLCGKGDPFHNSQWTKKLEGPWQFLGLGPPGSLQLQSGRVLVPGYHAYIRGLQGKDGSLPISQLYNNFAVGHTLISDDDGDTWRLSKRWPIGEGFNENQLVELADGTVLANARSLATGSPQYRVQSFSHDGGESFEASSFVTDIPQPFNGCQGSIVGPGGPTDSVYIANPDPAPADSIVAEFTKGLGCHVNLTGRSGVSVWRSTDGGRTYLQKQLIDAGLSAQTSLQFWNGKLMLMYEQSDPSPEATASDMLHELLLQNLQVLLPTRIIVREISFDSFETNAVLTSVI